jgi:hypothetical protein
VCQGRKLGKQAGIEKVRKGPLAINEQEEKKTPKKLITYA